MVFSSSTFIFIFLPCVLVFYKLAQLCANRKRRVQIQNAVLLVASLVFYGWSGVRYLVLVLALIIINYLCGLSIGRGQAKGVAHPRRALLVGLAADLAVLMVCKYFNFFVGNIESLVRHWTGNGEFSLNLPVIPLPIGISFFTFQIMSYLIDVYRGQVKVQRRLDYLTLYVLMFPQLIAGPIVRYADIEYEIENRTVSAEEEARGLRRFIMGFAKKVLLANAMGAFADTAFSNVADLHFSLAWLGAVCYALQIYMDFSAYSDMAIGLGWVFGFHFNENFNYPYVSRSVQEFWRRWHISLSTWFRDYVYIPLGGNRRGKGRTYLNLLIVFFLTGFWHGAAWQFLVWGLYHGFFLILERMGFGRALKKAPAFVGRIYTVVVVLVGWVFFRADGLGAAMQYLGVMAGIGSGTFWNMRVLLCLTGIFMAFASISVCISAPVFPTLARRAPKWTGVWNAICLVLFAYCICYMVGSSYNPFIYFRF